MNIKYRFWNTETKEMEYGNTNDLEFVKRSIGKECMLFTGFKNSMGISFYEGDIVKNPTSMYYELVQYDVDKMAWIRKRKNGTLVRMDVARNNILLCGHKFDCEASLLFNQP